MLAVLVCAITLMAAVLISALAQRSILSTAILFFVAGVVGAGHDSLRLVFCRACTDRGRVEP